MTEKFDSEDNSGVSQRYLSLMEVNAIIHYEPSLLLFINYQHFSHSHFQYLCEHQSKWHENFQDDQFVHKNVHQNNLFVLELNLLVISHVDMNHSMRWRRIMKDRLCHLQYIGKQFFSMQSGDDLIRQQSLDQLIDLVGLDREDKQL